MRARADRTAGRTGAWQPTRGRGLTIISPHAIVAAVQDHAAWAAPIVFVLAFGESLALVSLVVPATAMLVAIGGLVGAAGLPFWPVLIAAAAGAALGDWVSYAVGHHFKGAAARMWPLSRHPDHLRRAESLFRRWGVFGVFLGRFFGPVRSVVPLAAGITAMPFIPFQIANITSAIVWAFALLTPGLLAARWFW